MCQGTRLSVLHSKTSHFSYLLYLVHNFNVIGLGITSSFDGGSLIVVSFVVTEKFNKTFEHPEYRLIGRIPTFAMSLFSLTQYDPG